MKELQSTMTRTLLDDAEPESVIVHGAQIWQFWRGNTLIVKIVRMADPSAVVKDCKVSVDSCIRISWEMEGDGPAAATISFRVSAA